MKDYSWYSITHIGEDAVRMLVTGLLHAGWCIALLVVKTAVSAFKFTESLTDAIRSARPWKKVKAGA